MRRDWLRVFRNRSRISPSHACRPIVECLEDRLAPATLPPGFTEAPVASGLAAPTAMELAPDGRIFVTEQAGRVRVIENGVLLPTPALELAVDSTGERGLLGITLDPNFATNRFFYVYYTVASAPVHNRVSRFVVTGNVAPPTTETIVLELDNLSSAANHNGGALHFGPDGKLYIGVGENGNGANAQSLNNLLGKVLRINPDGTIPSDNPFVSTAVGRNRAIWALGLRNPFTFGVQPGTGRIFINDVGAVTWEEIDDGRAGGNYGWPATEGPTSDPRFISPLFAYGHGAGTTLGFAIAGGAFYNPASVQFPSDFVGDYFFGDFVNNWIRRLDPATGVVTLFASDATPGLVDLRVDASGSLYYLARGSGSDTGVVFRVQVLPPADGDNPRFVAGLYRDLLGRVADTPGLAANVAIVNSARDPILSTIATGYVTSVENRTKLVRSYYVSFLGRQGGDTEVNGWVSGLQNGLTPEQVEASFLGSSEYFLRVGNDNTRWLDQVYLDVLGRTRDSGSQGFLDALNRGTPRGDIAASILASTEFRSREVVLAYQRFLGRSASPGDVNAWLPLLAQPGAGAGQPAPSERFFAALLASTEFFLRQGNTNRTWVDALYTQLLGRSADAGGFENALATLLNGYGTARQNVALSVLTSAEYRTRLVASYYTRYLGRTASASDLDFWVGRLQNGATPEQVQAAIVGSPEYFQRRGSNNSAWLDQASLDLLGRPRDTGSQGFLNALQAGTVTREQVAMALLTSEEYRRLLATTFYRTYLGREPGSGEVTFWAEQLRQAGDDRTLAGFLSSREYFERARPYP